MKNFFYPRACKIVATTALLLFSHQEVNAQCTAPTSTIVNNSSCVSGTGSITFTGPTPVANYQFSIDGGITFGTAGQTSFTGLFGGTYPTVSKLVSTGCVSSVTNKVLTNPANPVNPTSTVVNNTNCNTPNGSITFTAPTPVANYQYSIDNGTTYGTSGQVLFNGLAAGSYSTKVRNAATGCVSGGVAKTITNPSIAAPVSAVTNVTNCNTPNGAINFTAQAGFVFSIDNGATFGTTGQTSFPGLTAGTYVTRSRQTSTGCLSATASKTVTSPTITAPTSTVLNVTNCNTPNGRITFTAPTPLASYQFSVDGGTTFGTTGQAIFNNLAPGTYVTVAKLVSSGCTSAKVNKVVGKPAVTAPTSAVTNVTNCNTPNGRITFSAPTPVANYQFSVNGGTTFGTTGQTVFNGLAAGTYATVSKLVSSGCTSNPVSKVVANPTVTAPTSTTTTSACNAPTGSIIFSAPTPTSSFSFSVDGGATFGTLGQTNFPGLAAGTYVTKTRSSVGCLSAGVNKTVTNTVTAAPTSTPANSTSCNPYNGTITFATPTPTANYQYSVDGGSTYGTAGQTLFSNLAPDVYLTRARSTVTGCVSAVANQTVGTSNSILSTTPTFSKTDVTTCATPNGSITFSAPGPAGVEFSVDGGTTWGPVASTTFSNLAAGTYTLYARNATNLCVSLPATATILKPVRAGTDKELCLEQTATMTATAAAGASWTALPTNPTVTTIATPTSATTKVSGFSALGTYSYIWANGSCSDTVNIVISDCLSPIGCTNSAFLYQSTSGSPTDIYSVDLATGTQTLLYPNIAALPNNINAVGFNVVDGHVWGSVVDGSGTSIGICKIARTGADGVPVFYEVNGLYTGGYNVGTVDNDGVMYLYSSNQTQIFRVDANPSSPTYLTVLAPTLTTTAMNIADWAFNPEDNMLYGVDNTSKMLYRINPNTGSVTNVGTVSGVTNFNNGSFGACYFDAQGNLYVGDNTLGGVYKINTVQNITGASTATLRSQGQPASGNDGALCQFACVKPYAGRDTMICIQTGAIMSATQVSGVGWSAVSTNPGTAVIVDTADANTIINSFSASGTYQFIWTNGGGCNDTAIVQVFNCIKDTVTVPDCDTCATVRCSPFNPDLPVTDTTTFSLCDIEPAGSNYGTITLDSNGCAVWTPNGTQTATDTAYTCLVKCNGPVCDTTIIIITPPPIVLPVSLVFFNGTQEQCNAALSWQTANETNSREFVVERSATGNSWMPLSVVAASGNSASLNDYRYTDEEAPHGKNMYRLKMTDLNGRYRYSKTVTVSNNCSTPVISVYPNPTDAQHGIGIRSDAAGEIGYKIFDATGRVQRSGTFTGHTEIKGLQPGVYLVQASNGAASITRKVVVR